MKWGTAALSLSAFAMACGDSQDDSKPSISATSSSTVASASSSPLAKRFVPYSEAECVAGVPPTRAAALDTPVPSQTPLPVGTIVTSKTFIPESFPLPSVISVTPPAATIVHLSDVGGSGKPGILFAANVIYVVGAGVNGNLSFRFGLDGSDVTGDLKGQGNEDSATFWYNSRLTVGDHAGAVSYCDNAGARYEYTWRFAVIE